jgi:hypothetical protein
MVAAIDGARIAVVDDRRRRRRYARRGGRTCFLSVARIAIRTASACRERLVVHSSRRIAGVCRAGVAVIGRDRRVNRGTPGADRRAGVDGASVVVVHVDDVCNACARVACIHRAAVSVIERKLVDDPSGRITAVDGASVAVVDVQWRPWETRPGAVAFLAAVAGVRVAARAVERYEYLREARGRVAELRRARVSVVRWSERRREAGAVAVAELDAVARVAVGAGGPFRDGDVLDGIAVRRAKIRSARVAVVDARSDWLKIRADRVHARSRELTSQCAGCLVCDRRVGHVSR